MIRQSKIIIGTRGSPLALKQTDIVIKKLSIIAPALKVELKIIKTEGDKNLKPIPLDTIGKGLFTKEIDKDLILGNIDLAVHSLKDLPEKLPDSLVISAFLEREDPREVLISKKNNKIKDLENGSTVGTDSSRRRAQLLQIRPDLIVKSIRGNVTTRLKKLEEGQDYDALILAAAGLKRLKLEAKIVEYFDPASFIPAPGQGTLAITTRKDDRKLNAIINRLTHQPTFYCSTAERSFSSSIGGGCKLPVGGYAICLGEKLILHGMIAEIDGAKITKGSIEGDCKAAKLLGIKLAAKILSEKSR